MAEPLQQPIALDDASVHPQVRALLSTRDAPRLERSSVLLRLLAPVSAMTLLMLGAVAMSVFSISTPAWLDGIWAWGSFTAAVVLMALLVDLQRFPWTRLLATAVVLAAAAIALHELNAPVAASLPLLAAAMLAGFSLSGSVHRLAWTIPVVAAAAISDLVSARSGPTAAYVRVSGASSARDTDASSSWLGATPDHVLDRAFLHMPVPDGTWVIGSVDMLVAALLLGASRAFGLSIWLTVAAMSVAFSVTLLFDGGAPLLPLLGAAFLIVHAPHILRSVRFEWRRFLRA